MNLEDPTRSRGLRDSYAANLVNITAEMLYGIDHKLEKIIGSGIKVGSYSKPKSYSSDKLRRSLETKISRTSKLVIAKAIRYQALHGVNLALNQAKVKERPRGVTGQYINKGTVQELYNTNVALVKSIQTRYLDKLQLLIARFVGGGTLTWDKLVKEVIRTISVAQKETLEKLGKKKWKWVTQLDERTCPVCRPLHNKTVEIGKPFTTYRGQPIFNSPVHPNCRCGTEVVL
jgi:hypothetical protein